MVKGQTTVYPECSKCVCRSFSEKQFIERLTRIFYIWCSKITGLSLNHLTARLKFENRVESLVMNSLLFTRLFNSLPTWIWKIKNIFKIFISTFISKWQDTQEIQPQDQSTRTMKRKRTQQLLDLAQRDKGSYYLKHL